MSNIQLRHYSPITETSVTLSVNEYKNYIEREPEVHGVKWKYHDTFYRTKDSDLPQKRRRTDNIWVTTYHCHRRGDKRIRHDKPVGGISKKPRPIQKASKKKIGCRAKLTVSCKVTDTNNVIVRYKGDHCHTPGNLEDLRTLPFSATVKAERTCNHISVFKAINSINPTRMNAPPAADEDDEDVDIMGDDRANVECSVLENKLKRIQDSIRLLQNYQTNVDTLDENMFEKIEEFTKQLQHYKDRQDAMTLPNNSNFEKQKR